MQSGFTLVEVMVAGALFALVGGIAYYIMTAGTVLYAKNYSINSSGGALRAGLDRINAEVSQATDMPQLVTLNGSGGFTTQAIVAGATAGIGPAAGIIFDKYLGGPYIMEGTGAATATTFSMKRSTNPRVIAPIPSADDVVLIDGSDNRSRVSTASGGVISSQLQSISVTLKSGNSSGIAWVAGDKKPATLVRRVAFIIVGNELRYYPTMEGATTYTTSATPYSVLTTDVGTSSGEATPFSIVIKNTEPFLSLSFRVQNRDNNSVLTKKEAKDFNTSMRIDTLLRPRNAQ